MTVQRLINDTEYIRRIKEEFVFGGFNKKIQGSGLELEDISWDLKRGLWRSTGIGRTIDTVKNIVDEGSISGGVKRMIKEDLTEDNPLGKMIYDSGRYDGKKRRI